VSAVAFVIAEMIAFISALCKKMSPICEFPCPTAGSVQCATSFDPKQAFPTRGVRAENLGKLPYTKGDMTGAPIPVGARERGD
jgi:hypothetical protein